MKFFTCSTALLAALFWGGAVGDAAGDTFGSGANAFHIEFVTIGHAGNPADTTGNPDPAGSVPYVFRMGKYEISEDMIDKANASAGLGITHDVRSADKPATSITWFEAAKFINWLNTSKGFTPAYKFDSGGNFQLWDTGDAGYDSENLYRNSLAYYFLPDVDEWYKAAYYDPVVDVYYNYPTGSDSDPDGIDFVGDTDFEAVFHDGAHNPAPNDITDVGVLSPYGTAGQGGNAHEWQETAIDLVNSSVSERRIVRGGLWSYNRSVLSCSKRDWSSPGSTWNYYGFRVASVPEPTGLALLVGVAIAVSILRKRWR